MVTLKIVKMVIRAFFAARNIRHWLVVRIDLWARIIHHFWHKEVIQLILVSLGLLATTTHDPRLKRAPLLKSMLHIDVPDAHWYLLKLQHVKRVQQRVDLEVRLHPDAETNLIGEVVELFLEVWALIEQIKSFRVQAFLFLVVKVLLVRTTLNRIEISFLEFNEWREGLHLEPQPRLFLLSPVPGDTGLCYVLQYLCRSLLHVPFKLSAQLPGLIPRSDQVTRNALCRLLLRLSDALMQPFNFVANILDVFVPFGFW